jgi:hypothetical protein
MRYAAVLLVAIVASLLVTETAIAKCASISTGERFSEAETVVLVAITDAQDGPVPWPYHLQKGAIPGRLLTLRVLKAWKGSYDTLSGWTLSPNIEHAYPLTDVGTQILVFYSKQAPHEVFSCNSAPPGRIEKTAEELDAIIKGIPLDPNMRWSGL